MITPSAGPPSELLDELREGLSVSIIVPTKNEAGNVRPLLERIRSATQDLDVEVIFVDDSSDDTPAVVCGAQRDFDFPVVLLHRPPERRNGLGKAVVEGIRCARSRWVCVMDGDLQHPPEVIPQLLDRAYANGADLVAASRLTQGGDTSGLSFQRKLISYGLALLSRVVFPKRLRQVTDPLTGFFLFRRDTVDPDTLQPEGFKILLEILLRTRQLQVTEVPFAFAERHAGESKANSQEAMLLFRQMVRLYASTQQRLARFMAVGASGLVVNNLVMLLLVELGSMHYLLSAALATQASSLWNFGLTEEWVFRDRKRTRGFGYRLLGFLGLNNVMLVLRGPMLVVLVSWLGMHYLVANLISLGVMMLARYAISDQVIWRPQPRVPAPETFDDLPLRTASSIVSEKL